jgi:hypothetical protein
MRFDQSRHVADVPVRPFEPVSNMATLPTPSTPKPPRQPRQRRRARPSLTLALLVIASLFAASASHTLAQSPTDVAGKPAKMAAKAAGADNTLIAKVCQVAR